MERWSWSILSSWSGQVGYVSGIFYRSGAVSGGWIYRRPNDQWRLHRRPQSEMRPVLCQCQIAISDLEHVRVIVAPEVDRVQFEAVEVGDGGDARPVC